MKNCNLNRLIVLLLIVGVGLSLELVIKEISQINVDVCPKIGIVPACYLALTYFVLLLFIQLRNKNEILFFIFSGFALALSLFATVGNIIGTIECPTSFLQLPLCFIAFIVFAIIVILKFIVVKKNKEL